MHSVGLHGTGKWIVGVTCAQITVIKLTGVIGIDQGLDYDNRSFVLDKLLGAE